MIHAIEAFVLEIHKLERKHITSNDWSCNWTSKNRKEKNAYWPELETESKKRANLKLFKTCIHPFMKFSPHSAKIHRLFDDFIIIFYLTTANDSSYIAQERQRNIYDLTLWTNNQFQTSLVSTGSANISWVSFLIRIKIWCIMCNKLCYKIQTNKHCDLSSKISKRSFFFYHSKEFPPL